MIARLLIRAYNQADTHAYKGASVSLSAAAQKAARAAAAGVVRPAAASAAARVAAVVAAMARRALAGRLVSPKLFSLPPLVYLNSRVRRSCQAAPPNPPSPRREVAGEDIEADLDDEDQLEV